MVAQRSQFDYNYLLLFFYYNFLRLFSDTKFFLHLFICTYIDKYQTFCCEFSAWIMNKTYFFDVNSASPFHCEPRFWARQKKLIPTIIISKHVLISSQATCFLTTSVTGSSWYPFSCPHCCNISTINITKTVKSLNT